MSALLKTTEAQLSQVSPRSIFDGDEANSKSRHFGCALKA